MGVTRCCSDSAADRCCEGSHRSSSCIAWARDQEDDLNRRLLSALSLAVFLVAACAADGETGSGSPEGNTQASSPTAAPEETGGPEGSEGESEVRAAFEAFRSALLTKDGDAFAGLVAEETLDHYEELRDLALTASRAELTERLLGHQIYALFLRHEFPPERLADLDGPAIAAALVNEGAISEGAVDGVRAGAITVSGSDATVEASVKGDASAFSYTFRRESDSWKIDLIELNRLADTAYRQQMHQYGLDQDEYVLTVVEAFVGSRPSDRIWQPPRS